MIARKHIVIKGIGSISPLGHQAAEISQAYLHPKSAIRPRFYNGEPIPVAGLSDQGENIIQAIRQEDRFYKNIDRTALLAIYAARQAVAQAGWQTEKEVAINIGSSRGATALFEKYYDDFRTGSTHLSSQASPTTTLGNISSWVAHDLETEGPVISHSITCSTALQAIANGFAWLQSGMASRFLAGAAEASLTPFTLAQMQAIGIYAQKETAGYWCRPLNAEKRNTFVLGEGAALFALESLATHQLPADIICLEAIGFGFEKIQSRTGISPDGLHFQKAMRQVLQQLEEDDQTIDAIVLHAPGTVAGDQAELNAISAIFGENLPVLTSNKMLIGHTLGASAALSLEYAVFILNCQHYLDFPYPTFRQLAPAHKPIRRVLILAAGFGGNAAALVVKRN